MPEIANSLHEWLTNTLGLELGPWSGAIVVVAALVAGKLTHFILAVTLHAWTKKTKTNLDEAIVAKLQGPVVLSVFLYGLLVATGMVELSEKALERVQHVLLTLGLAVWFLFFLRLSHILLAHASSNPEKYKVVESRTFPLFENLSRIFILGAGIYMLLVIWDGDPTGWLASAGIAGVAIGFAAKDTLSNLFAGVFIVADGPYRIGDYIVLDGSTRGRVVNIGLRSTRVLTRDDVEITIPNSVISSSQITNQSGGGTTRMRVRVKISVGYDSDVDLVRSILMDIAKAEPGACDFPEPRVRFRRFGPDGLEFELMVWVRDPSLRGQTLDALNTSILKAFREAGIEIPYPKRDVYMHHGPKAEQADS